VSWSLVTIGLSDTTIGLGRVAGDTVLRLNRNSRMRTGVQRIAIKNQMADILINAAIKDQGESVPAIHLATRAGDPRVHSDSRQKMAIEAEPSSGTTNKSIRKSLRTVG
ncbi:MAG: hypothetical protein ABI612_16640, partial [Betaproteobacteria bacterium]